MKGESDSTEILDTRTQSISAGPPMACGRYNHGVGLLTSTSKSGTKLAVFGGFNENRFCLNDVEYYDPIKCQWHTTDMKLARTKSQFAFLSIQTKNVKIT